MGWHGYIDWQSFLSLVTPATVAAIICLAEARGPLSPYLRQGIGVVPPYFSSIAVVFGLFTALLMNDVWQRENAARQAVQAEDNAVRGLAHLARVGKQEAVLTPLLRAYMAAAARESPFSKAPQDARNKTDRAYEALLNGISNLRGLDVPAKANFQSVATELRQARDRRLYLADDETAAIKWLSVLVLGALTQIALMLVHMGVRRAIHVSLGLFTVAFTFCLVIVAVFNQPFETSLASEPGLTFDRTLRDFKSAGDPL